jgi:hypothetical protein
MNSLFARKLIADRRPMLLREHAASVSSIFLRNQKPGIPVLEGMFVRFEEADFICM